MHDHHELFHGNSIADLQELPTGHEKWVPKHDLLFSLDEDELLELARRLVHFVLLLQSGPPTSTLQINGSGTKKMPS